MTEVQKWTSPDTSDPGSSDAKHDSHPFRSPQWLRFSQDGTQEIYFRVPSKTTPTTLLVAVIKAHPNRKTNLNAKTNPNPDLQKTVKKKLKKTLKNYSTHGIRTRDS